MDSLTQVVLGAAVGEVILGKKLGNKAMVWGAIAGTIPDLDTIVGSIFMNRLDSLAFHRGISHSIFFALTFSFLIAYFAKTFYDKEYYRISWVRTLGSVLSTIFTLILVGVFGLAGYVFGGTTGLIICGLPCLLLSIYLIRRIWVARKTTLDIDTNISFKKWYFFFFWAIFTHPILDCFTVYGTQLFAPFSYYRVSWDNISVADPIYTLSFGAFLLIGSHYPRLNFNRRKFTYIGIALSTMYMALTFYNKSKVNQVMENTLVEEKIDYNRYMTSPTILNNILWSGTVDTDTSFWIGQYSLLDKTKKFDLKEINKNYHLLHYPTDKTRQVLEWFTKDYCAVIRRSDGKIQINDLRYGQFNPSKDNNENNYVFRFVLEDDGQSYQLGESEGGPPPGEESNMFNRLWNRILGKKD